ncbi:Ig-like domain-containing protein, partial [Herbiconiux daphne]
CWIGGTNHIPGSNPPNVSPSVTPVITKQPVATFSTTSGGTITLSVTATSTAGTLSYQWYKDNSAILGQKSDTLTINNATIGQSGNYSVRVTNTESGKRPITVTSNTSNVTVTQAVIEATGITISGPTGGLAIGTTRPLTVTLTPTGAVAIVTWYSSDQLIATVSTTGVVTALKKGSAVISATITKSDGTVVTSNNYNLSVVDAQATGMSFTRTTETITSGNTTTIAYTFVPQGSTGTIVLSSSNDNVAKATLDSTGKIITLEGVSAGTATISATVNGYQSSNSVAVTVEQKQSTMPDYDRTIKYDINVQAGQPIDIVIPMKNQSVMGTVTYKWVKDDGSANGVDTGITTQNFHIDNATLAEAGVYYCWVTNTDAGASPTTITTPKATVVVSATVIPDASWVADMPTTLDAGTDFDIEWQDGVGPFEVREIRTSDTPEHLVNNSTQAGRTYKFETFGDRYNQAYKKAGTYRVDIVDKGVTPNKTLQSRITSLHDYHINLVKSSGDGTLAAYNPATYNQALEIDEGKTIELTVQKIDELTNTAVASGGNNFKILLAGDSSIATGTIKASDTNKRTLVIAGVKAGTTTYSLTTSDMKGDSDLVITVKSTAPVEPKVASVQIAKRFDVLRSDAAAPYNTNIINPAAPIRALDASGNVVDASKYTVKWELDGTTAGADISPDGKLTWTPGTVDPNVDVKVTVTNNSDSSTVTATGTL